MHSIFSCRNCDIAGTAVSANKKQAGISKMALSLSDEDKFTLIYSTVLSMDLALFYGGPP